MTQFLEIKTRIYTAHGIVKHGAFDVSLFIHRGYHRTQKQSGGGKSVAVLY